jgi:hypothetical protein
MDEATLQRLVLAALDHKLPHCLVGRGGSAGLLSLPAAQQFSRKAVVELMKTAAKQWYQSCCEALVKLPAAQQLGRSTVAYLLQCALNSNNEECFHMFAALPAARQVDSATVVQMMQAAIACGNCRHLKLLLELPAAQRLSSCMLTALLQAAAEQSLLGHQSPFRLLADLPAAQQLSSTDVAQLLQSTLEGDNEQCFFELAELPAAQQLGIAAAVQMLQAAASRGNSKHLELLLELPAVQRLFSSCAAQEANTAVARQHQCLHMLCGLLSQLNDQRPNGSQGNMGQLMHAAMRSKCDVCVRALCHLPRARQLDEINSGELGSCSTSAQVASMLGGPSRQCRLTKLARSTALQQQHARRTAAGNSAGRLCRCSTTAV